MFERDEHPDQTPRCNADRSYTIDTMLTLDGFGDRMDSSYLHAMSIRHFYVAGAINGDDGPATARWFCAIGSNEELDFASVLAARRFLQDTCSQLLEPTSNACDKRA